MRPGAKGNTGALDREGEQECRSPALGKLSVVRDGYQPVIGSRGLSGRGAEKLRLTGVVCATY